MDADCVFLDRAQPVVDGVLVLSAAFSLPVSLSAFSASPFRFTAYLLSTRTLRTTTRSLFSLFSVLIPHRHRLQSHTYIHTHTHIAYMHTLFLDPANYNPNPTPLLPTTALLVARSLVFVERYDMYVVRSWSSRHARTSLDYLCIPNHRTLQCASPPLLSRLPIALSSTLTLTTSPRRSTHHVPRCATKFLLCSDL